MNKLVSIKYDFSPWGMPKNSSIPSTGLSREELAGIGKMIPLSYFILDILDTIYLQLDSQLDITG